LNRSNHTSRVLQQRGDPFTGLKHLLQDVVECWHGPARRAATTVSIEMEMFKSAEAASQHDQAMTVYSKSLELLRTALGKY
jgi:hypothetical protein